MTEPVPAEQRKIVVLAQQIVARAKAGVALPNPRRGAATPSAPSVYVTWIRTVVMWLGITLAPIAQPAPGAQAVVM